MSDTSADPSWFLRMVEVLEEHAARERPLTYADLAAEAGVPGPQTIHKVTEALEILLERDFREGAPLRAAIAVSKARGGLPAPGFFQQCSTLGLYFGPDRGPQAETFHRLELDRLFVNYRDARANS